MALGLSLLIGLPVLGAVIALVRWGGPYFYVYVWAFLCVMSIFLMTIYPTLIAPLFNTYKKLESGPIYTAIEDLAKRVSFPLTQIYEVDGSRRSAHSNAYFYGFFKVFGFAILYFGVIFGFRVNALCSLIRSSSRLLSMSCWPF